MKTQRRARAYNVVLEITRRCNMSCAHCLRGNAQPKDIKPEILENFFAPLSYIQTLTLTGGEPALRPRLMLDVLEICKKYRVQVGSVYIVTNGKQVTDDFLDAIHQWDKYAIMSYFDFQPDSPPHTRMLRGNEAFQYAHQFSHITDDERETGCWIALSTDAYHEDIPEENIMQLALHTRLLPDDKHMNEDRTDDWVIQEGRAKQNGIGRQTLREQRPWLYAPGGAVLDIDTDAPDDDPEFLAPAIEEVFCSVIGDILKTCDASYATQKKLRHFNLADLQPGENWVDRSVARKLFLESHEDVRPPAGLSVYDI